jgi:hypothetical protein
MRDGKRGTENNKASHQFEADAFSQRLREACALPMSLAKCETSSGSSAFQAMSSFR